MGFSQWRRFVSLNLLFEKHLITTFTYLYLKKMQHCCIFAVKIYKMKENILCLNIQRVNEGLKIKIHIFSTVFHLPIHNSFEKIHKPLSECLIHFRLFDGAKKSQLVKLTDKNCLTFLSVVMFLLVIRWIKFLFAGKWLKFLRFFYIFSV